MQESMGKSLSAREAAVKMLLEVCKERHFSHEVKGKYLSKIPEKRERALATRLFEGCLERLLELDYIINLFSKTPVKKMKPTVAAILRITVYQIRFMDKIPISAACNEAVNLTKKYGFSGLSGFVNGVARNIARAEEIPYPDRKKDETAYLSVKYSMQTTMVEQMLSQYGAEQTERILNAFFEEKQPLTLRIFGGSTGVERVKRAFGEAGIPFENGYYSKEVVRVLCADMPERLPLFAEGGFYIQDESSMQAVLAAGLTGEEKVLDLCGAPGGKTVMAADILACSGKGTVESRDCTEIKTGLLEENIKRCRLGNVQVRLSDATIYRPADEEAYDVVFADVPCSGVGIISKKPDIKLFMTTELERELCRLQKKILSNAVRYVKKGGVLIFSTCTLNTEENMGGYEFLKEQGMVPESLNPYLSELLWNETTSQGYLQMIPGIHKTDGFFVSRFRKSKD